MLKMQKVTDILCLTLFVGVVGAMVGFSTYGYTFGNVYAVIGGLDGAGNLCGVGNFSDYPYMYITNF